MRLSRATINPGNSLPLVQHLLDKTEVKAVGASRRVLMNRTELPQVLINLIVNAIHVMADGGRITLRSSDADRDGVYGIRIEIADTGTGMGADVVEEDLRSLLHHQCRGGTGLGPSISETLIKRQRGEISVESRIGEGSTFSAWMPEAN